MVDNLLAQGEVILDSLIPDLPWGVVSLVDLYSGFVYSVYGFSIKSEFYQL